MRRSCFFGASAVFTRFFERPVPFAGEDSFLFFSGIVLYTFEYIAWSKHVSELLLLHDIQVGSVVISIGRQRGIPRGDLASIIRSQPLI